MKNLILSILLIISFNHINAQTQVPILDRKISLHIRDQSLGKVLNIISETAKFTFSYNASLVKVNKIVSISAENKTVREILDQLFENQLTYQQIGNHLVLQKKIQPKPAKGVGETQKQEKYEMIVSGYLRDISTGDGISDVSIYHKASLSNTISGEYGYYKIRVISKTEDFDLQIRKDGYRDTFIHVRYDQGGVIEMPVNLVSSYVPEAIVSTDTLPTFNYEVPVMRPDSTVPFDSLSKRQQDSAVRFMLDSLMSQLGRIIDTAESRLRAIDTMDRESVENTKLGNWLIGAYHKIINNNIRDTFARDWQVTFVPPIGTNGTLSGLVENKVSFNALVGYNGGLNGAEFGGFLNFLRGNMNGAQFSGFGNIVGGHSSGAQFAGFFNHNLGNSEGFQAAGFYNYNHYDSRGMQAAGFVNINRGNFDGMQAAGFANIVHGYTRGVQAAGFVNVATEIDGGQMAGFVNIARKVRGFQIGVVNIADSSEGIAIGIVNFIKNGIHQLEFSRNELEQYGLAYRSGSGKFYSIINVNSQWPIKDTGTLMCYGFGIGYRARLSKVFYWTTEIGAQHMTFNFRSDHLNLHNRLNTGLEIRLFKGFAVFGGVSLNHMINDTYDPRYDTRFSSLAPNTVWEMQQGGYKQSVWCGWQFGLRLF